MIQNRKRFAPRMLSGVFNRTHDGPDLNSVLKGSGQILDRGVMMGGRVIDAVSNYNRQFRPGFSR